MLTENTLQSLRQGLAISELPRRFQDALAIARWMQVNYVWIDALCILQDSEEDWLKQSTIMGDIYANCYCNIAATSGDPKKGCFTDRSTEMVEPYFISNPRADDNARTYVVGYDDFWSNSLLDTDLHKRAWVLQERLLSPRAIHFGQEQIFWECRCEKACEAYPQGIPEQFSNWRIRSWRQSDAMLDPAERQPMADPEQYPSLLGRLLQFLTKAKPRSVPLDAASIYKIWSKTIERYMECELTYSEDKLVALSGIAQRVTGATNERYLAGLWDNPLLASSLLWYVVARKQANGTRSTRAPSLGKPGYRAPSWSWASLDAKLTWNWPAECDEILISILDTDVKPSKGRYMSTVSSAKMDLKGQLFKADLTLVTRSEHGTFEEDGRYGLRLLQNDSDRDEDDSSIQEASLMEPVIYLDVPLTPSAVSTTCYLLPVCTGWKGRSGDVKTELAGLLLRKNSSSASDTLYERIGIFGLDDSEASTLYPTQRKRSVSAGRDSLDANPTFVTIV